MTTYRVPPATRCYAIGDIHGRADHLKKLHALIAADAESYKERVVIVYLGDYVDRGPQSREVIEMLMGKSPVRAARRIFLKGNHERSFLDFLDRPAKGRSWLDTFGGAATLRSYGIPVPAEGGDLKALSAAMHEALPHKHRLFLESTKLHHAEGDYFFAHAGVRPGVALEKQSEDDLLFIRDDFVDTPHNLPCKVVYGHTIVPEALNADDRIAVDTGAYAGGPLTAVVLEGGDVRFLQSLNRAGAA